MYAHSQTKPIDILLIEDNPGDVRLTQEAISQSNLWVDLHVVVDGVEALDFLSRTGKFSTANRPDLIFLDLNLPRKDGRQVLEEIKSDPELRAIPIIVMTTSKAEEDINHVYGLLANCYISKPIDFDQYAQVIKTIEAFWLNLVKLPMP